MKYGFGIDIGSSTVRFAFFDETGKLLHKWSIPTPSEYGSAQVLPGIADELEQYMNSNRLTEDDILGVGVGIPGPVNSGGTVNRCVNMGWGVFNIDRNLSGLTGLKVVSSNIANMAALGESWKGCCKGCKDVFYVAMNTGIGGAIISNGHLVQGAHGGGGEVGHMIVNRQETESCTCGSKGCVEQYCSPFGIVRVAKRHLASVGHTTSTLRFRRHLSHVDVFQAAASGDKTAKEILDKVCQYAGEMIANVCCVTNPGTIVLGGELCKYGPQILDGTARYFRKYAFHANREVRFELAALGEDAPLIGAFKLVLDSAAEE